VPGNQVKNKDKSMNHKTRVLICRYISTHPGVSISQLSSVFDFNYSTLKYHLKYLEKNNIIVSKKDGRMRRLYTDLISAKDTALDLQSTINSLNMNQQLVLRTIQNNPGISKKDLIKLTNLNRKTIEYSLNKFIDKKLVWKVTYSNNQGYEYITEEKLRYEILNQLLNRLLSNEIDERTFHLLKEKLENMSFDELRAERIG
jgi:predicted transcriptional regulator